MKKFLVIIIYLFLILHNNKVYAKEEILDYFITIDIQKDNSAIITEKLIVNVESKKVKHGIVKELPLDNDYVYKLISVKRNQNIEPSSIKIIDNIYKIITGDDNYLPTFKRHFFEIKYRVENIIKYTRNFNELHWNVIDNKMGLNIDKIRIKIIMPDTIKKIGQYGYININTDNKEPLQFNNNIFKSPRKIIPGEDITIVLLFKNLTPFFNTYNYKFLYYIVGAFLTIILYCMICLLITKRKNKKLIPFDRFDTIKDMTPAQASYIYNMGENIEKSSLISIINMAINNFIIIRQDTKNKFLISKNEFSEVHNEEENIFQNTYKRELKVSEENNRKIRLFNERLKYYYSYNKSYYFSHNWHLTIIGHILFIISILCLLLIKNNCSLSFVGNNNTSLILFALFSSSLIYIKNILKAKKILGFIMLIFIFLYINNFNNNSLLLIRYILASTFVLYFFKKFIKNYTNEGLEIITHLKGIKQFIMYKDITSQYDFNDMEKLIPYAMIFDLDGPFLAKLKLSPIDETNFKQSESFIYNVDENMINSLKEAFNRSSSHSIYTNPEFAPVRKGFFN